MSFKPLEIDQWGTWASTVNDAKSNLWLNNVDNTSDATKNSATATLTNKDLTSWTNTFPSAVINTIESDPSAVTGADQVTNVMSLTTAEYWAITPNASTLYIITDA